MMKFVAIMVVSTMLSGCGWFERQAAVVTGYSRVCVAGVSYLQFPSGVTVEYTKDGKVKTCD